MTIFIRTVAGGLGAAVALVASAGPAVASTVSATTGGATAVVGQLVLEPTARGYQGTLPITVTNHSAQPVSHLLITEPVAGSWRGTLSNEFCMVVVPKQYVRTFDCMVSLGAGQSRTYTARFEVLTHTRPYAMSARGGQVAVQVGHDAPVTTSATFRTLFRSTDGSRQGRRPYRQDRTTEAAIATGEARLVQQADGTFAGWLPVTARYDSDAANHFLDVAATLPAGVDIVDMDPPDMPVFSTGFLVPGGAFTEGEERIFRVLLTAPAGTAPGLLGTGTFAVSTYYEGGAAPEGDPSDNTVTFPIRVGA
ncbi:hypothetical protein [Micromonospora sp. IBHARD004]|uniref:hypothetical protein n=1 Tax=Micromonospora sp. IBHARD004 TaxID=3457764 RepID=UPI004058FECA